MKDKTVIDSAQAAVKFVRDQSFEGRRYLALALACHTIAVHLRASGDDRMKFASDPQIMQIAEIALWGKRLGGVETDKIDKFARRVLLDKPEPKMSMIMTAYPERAKAIQKAIEDLGLFAEIKDENSVVFRHDDLAEINEKVLKRPPMKLLYGSHACIYDESMWANIERRHDVEKRYMEKFGKMPEVKVLGMPTGAKTMHDVKEVEPAPAEIRVDLNKLKCDTIEDVRDHAEYVYPAESQVVKGEHLKDGSVEDKPESLASPFVSQRAGRFKSPALTELIDNVWYLAQAVNTLLYWELYEIDPDTGPCDWASKNEELQNAKKRVKTIMGFLEKELEKRDGA